jgi:hypothetical protein
MDIRISEYQDDKETNVRLRSAWGWLTPLRCSLRLTSFGYVYRRHKLNDTLRLTQPIRAAHPVDEDAEFGLNYAKQSQFSKKSNGYKIKHIKGLQEKIEMDTWRKQTQSKPIRHRFTRLWRVYPPAVGGQVSDEVKY